MIDTALLRQSTLAIEGPLQASKWLKVPILVDAKEMAALFTALGPFYIAFVGSLQKKGEGLVSHADFLKQYSAYVEDLQKGTMPDEAQCRPYFSSVFTVTLDALYSMPMLNQHHLIRCCRPVIQLQIHRMDYSRADEKFRSMTFGAESLLWGIQFSYPQLFQENQTHEVKQVIESDEFPNTHLFKTLQQWVRHHTSPTPFIVDEKKINVPVRLGKKCFSWINNHPQFAKKGLRVA